MPERQDASTLGTPGHSATQRLYVAMQYVLPHHLLSALVHAATRWRWRPWKNFLIRSLSSRFNMDLSEAIDADPDAYPSFNAFFTRALKPEVRPIATEADAVVCPADGTVSQAGAIEAGRVFQAKGQSFSCLELLGGDQHLAHRFDNGQFATIYLSPRDYHRVHMSISGRLLRDIYVPGRLFSVAPLTVEKIPRLFARNERIACIFRASCGQVAQVLVGAINVSAMETVWQGEVPASRGIRQRNYAGDSKPLDLERGVEMGRFNMGSTVILLFPPDSVSWNSEFVAGRTVRMGEKIGTLRQPGVSKVVRN